MNPRDIEFLFEIGTMKNVDRSWRQHLGMECASNLEHSFRVVFLALLIARREGGADESKIIKMALVHDLAEARTSDLGYMQKIYVASDEERAARDMFAGTSLTDLCDDVLHEYKLRESIEAKIVKDADNLDVDVEMKELEERGSLMPEKWKPSRRIVRDQKLYTNAAKALWDELQSSDPSSWHLTSNKWHVLPNAGR